MDVHNKTLIHNIKQIEYYKKHKKQLLYYYENKEKRLKYMKEYRNRNKTQQQISESKPNLRINIQYGVFIVYFD